MSTQPSEPEKYSIDEMMDRLKTRSSEDPVHEGELVIREDGSQAIRVRKRKRRSHQPHKEELRQTRRARMIQVSAALILLLMAVFGAGVAIVFANSAPFREGLKRKIAMSSGAGVELDQFRMNPTNANATRLALTWPEGNALRDLTLRGVKAEISPSSFFGKSLTGEEVSSVEGTLTLRPPQPGKPLCLSEQSGGIPPIRFTRYAIPKFHVLIGDPTAPIARMQNSEGSFTPVNPNGRAQLLINRGDVTINGWPKFRMDRSHIEFIGRETDIIGMRLQHATDTKGILELSGIVTPYAMDRASTLSVHLESFLISGITGSDFGRLFSGRIDTAQSAKSNYFTFTPGPTPDTSLAIAFHNSLTSNVEVSGFPFLFEISRILDEEWFLRPVFDNDVTGTLRRGDGFVTIGDLRFENKGRMALRGAVTMAPDKSLSGGLQVGVADAMIKASRNRRLDSIFGPSSEGFRWVTLKISGTSTAPADNFKELFTSAKTEETQTPTAEVPTFEQLTQPK